MDTDRETSLASIITGYVDSVRLLASIVNSKEISEENKAQADVILSQFKEEFGEEMIVAD